MPVKLTSECDSDGFVPAPIRNFSHAKTKICTAMDMGTGQKHKTFDSGENQNRVGDSRGEVGRGGFDADVYPAAARETAIQLSRQSLDEVA
jgi:hypothetical protein